MDEEWVITPKRTGHPAVAATLVFAGSLLVVALIFSVWANRQALDTDSWVKTSDRVLDDVDVQVELARYVSDELFDSLDLKGDLRRDLPERLQNLPDTTPEGLRRQGPVEVLKALNTPRFKQIWSGSNRAAHEALIDELETSDDLSGETGKVTLDLNPIVTGMSTELGFDDDATGRIPPDVARLTVAEGDQVETARNAVRAARALPLVLGGLVIVLFGGAILLAGPYRRRIVLASGSGLVIAGGVTLMLRSAAEPSVAGWFATEDSVRPAIEAAWRIGTSGLVTMSVLTMALGAVIMFGAGLAALWGTDRRGPRRRQPSGF